MCCHTTSGVHQIGKSIKVHLYWAMKNCGDSPSKLQELILNIPCHYQVHVLMSFILHSVINILYMYIFYVRVHTCKHVGQHSKCPSTSAYHTQPYTPNKTKLINQKAIESLSWHLKSTYIYRNAVDICWVRIINMLQKN